MRLLGANRLGIRLGLTTPHQRRVAGTWAFGGAGVAAWYTVVTSRTDEAMARLPGAMLLGCCAALITGLL